MLVELRDVWKRYHKDYVLRGVNLVVGEGEFVTIRGRTGAGKTTLLKIMALLLRADRGVVKVLGQDAGRLSDSERARLRAASIGFIPQLYDLIPSLTVLENVELPMVITGVPRAERRRRALEALSLLGIEDLADRPPEDLSGGERQRVAIARAIAKRPKLLLADEPLAHLDDQTARSTVDLMERLCRENGVAVVLTTTDLHEPFPAQRDYLLKNGKLLPLRQTAGR